MILFNYIQPVYSLYVGALYANINEKAYIHRKGKRFMQKSDKYKIKENTNNLVKYVYNSLREDLIKNRIRAGDFLSANSIAKEYKVSRTPVREALKILENDDVVKIIDGVGAQVKTISLDEIRNIFEVRKALEKIAAKTAIYNISIEELILLEEQIKKLANGFDEYNKPVDAFHAKHNRIHSLIIERCNNSYVKKIMGSIDLKISMFKHLSVHTEEKVMESSIQHLKILRLIKERDIKNLEEEIDKHLEWTLNCLLYSI